MLIVADEKSQLRRVEEQVQAKLGDAVPVNVVRRELRRRLKAFDGAPVRTYVPLLLHKQLLDDLRPRS
ncbi:MAG: hypothetical protein NVSMB55_08410 [Mycobacteriales bacterium]